MKCSKCTSNEAEFDSPAILCRLCWAEWWAIEDNDKMAEEEKAALRQETLQDLDELDQVEQATLREVCKDE